MAIRHYNQNENGMFAVWRQDTVTGIANEACISCLKTRHSNRMLDVWWNITKIGIASRMFEVRRQCTRTGIANGTFDVWRHVNFTGIANGMFDVWRQGTLTGIAKEMFDVWRRDTRTGIANGTSDVWRHGTLTAITSGMFEVLRQDTVIWIADGSLMLSEDTTLSSNSPIFRERYVWRYHSVTEIADIIFDIWIYIRLIYMTQYNSPKPMTVGGSLRSEAGKGELAMAAHHHQTSSSLADSLTVACRQKKKQVCVDGVGHTTLKLPQCILEIPTISFMAVT